MPPVKLASMPRSRWAQALARLVHETELNQSEIARGAKITPNTITNIIYDKHVPTLDVLLKIADVLKVDITEMLATESQSRVLRAAATFGTAHEGALIEALLQKIEALQHRVGELEAAPLPQTHHRTGPVRRLSDPRIDPKVLRAFQREARRQHIEYQMLINKVLALAVPRLKSIA